MARMHSENAINQWKETINELRSNPDEWLKMRNEMFANTDFTIYIGDPNSKAIIDVETAKYIIEKKFGVKSVEKEILDFLMN